MTVVVFSFFSVGLNVYTFVLNFPFRLDGEIPITKKKMVNLILQSTV